MNVVECQNTNKALCIYCSSRYYYLRRYDIAVLCQYASRTADTDNAIKQLELTREESKDCATGLATNVNFNTKIRKPSLSSLLRNS